MPLYVRLSSFFRNLVSRTAVDRELDQELESYVDFLAEEQVRQGIDPTEARRLARVGLGSKESVKMKVREKRIGHSFDTLLQNIRYGATFSADGRPEQVRQRIVTPNFLSVYGLQPHTGRAFVAEDDHPIPFEGWGNPCVTIPTGVVMISYEFWRVRFGRDPGVVGKLVQLDSYPYQIIGVTPPNFSVLIPDDGDYTVKVQVWALGRMDFRRMPRDTSFLRVVGRLKPGVRVRRSSRGAALAPPRGWRHRAASARFTPPRAHGLSRLVPRGLAHPPWTFADAPS